MAAGKCKAAYHTDEWHGYGCEITDGNTEKGRMQR